MHWLLKYLRIYLSCKQIRTSSWQITEIEDWKQLVKSPPGALIIYNVAKSIHMHAKFEKHKLKIYLNVWANLSVNNIKIHCLSL